jgi:hypothetical protein
MEDFEEALKEVKPAFGAVTETLEAYRLNGIIDYGEHCRHLLSVCKQLVEQARPLCCFWLCLSLCCSVTADRFMPPLLKGPAQLLGWDWHILTHKNRHMRM